MKIDLKYLQKRLALVDMLSSKSDNSEFLEILVAKNELLKLKMYQEPRHPTPHVHVDYGSQNHRASYRIDTGERLVGSLPKKYDTEVKNWILSNKEKLLTVWADLQGGGTGGSFEIGLTALGEPI